MRNVREIGGNSGNERAMARFILLVSSGGAG